MFSRILVFVSVLYVSVDYVRPNELKDLEYNRRWDMFILSQRWPATVCIANTARDNTTHCQFPKNRESWTVAGLWPVRIGTFLPTKCNLSWPFNPDEVHSIVTDLSEHWTNIKKETNLYSYWDFQWVNHGTCSANLETVNTPLKYFQAGLGLHKKNLIYEILSAANIVPDDEKPVTAEEIRDAVTAKLGTQAFSFCQDIGNVQYLRELYLCFDKQLNLITCEGMIVNKGSKTNCDLTRPIIYPTMPK